MVDSIRRGGGVPAGKPKAGAAPAAPQAAGPAIAKDGLSLSKPASKPDNPAIDVKRDLKASFILRRPVFKETNQALTFEQWQSLSPKQQEQVLKLMPKDHRESYKQYMSEDAHAGRRLLAGAAKGVVKALDWADRAGAEARGAQEAPKGP